MLIAFTWFVTRRQRDKRRPTVGSPWLQLAACLISVVVSGFADAVGNGALSLRTWPVAGLPAARLAASGAPGEWRNFVGGGLAQFFLYVLITASLLLPFRVPARDLYLQLNLRASIPVGIGWIVPEIAVMAYRFTHGAHGFFDVEGPATVIRRLRLARTALCVQAERARRQSTVMTPIPLPPKPDLSSMNIFLGKWTCTTRNPRRPTSSHGALR